ncbi:type I-Fv CRISPR-associated protein Cas5fv [Aliikangiella sp. IMCC44359]|uniref:type I-Fv CRISPR-associated protein Cas5fv n=1 Tax=Aliikangiella sp. IMCC44359 TaxID=3459125 RepID=UPI00403AC895
MRIVIEYDSSWRNSFLDGSNNEPLPKQKDGTYRKFIGSMKNLNNEVNFIKREVTIDTVMGIVNRLIGDQKKLYQARNSNDYYFRDLESSISFQDYPNVINHEMTYIRNISGSTDQNSYTGMIKVNDPIFLSDYSKEFWSVLFLDIEQLYQFVVTKNLPNVEVFADPLLIIARLEELNKLKPIENIGIANEAYKLLSDKFVKFKGLNKNGFIYPISLYCSSLYLQLDLLSDNKFDMSTARTKAGGISGISNNGFTKKDFMSRYTTGDKKKIWGNPYIHEEFVKGEGKIKHLMTKASGQLEIEIDINREKAEEISSMIENAGVSSFYLGKKGLAYVSKIDTRPRRI